VYYRRSGLPFGVYAGITLPARFPDTLATVLAALIVFGAAALMVRGQGPAQSPVRSPRAAIAAAVVAGVLALTGVLSQAGAFASSSGNGGGGGVSGPYTPGGGGGTSGGGTSGGGIPGY
jgi:uncharacterized membrane protein YgcG